MIGQTTAVNQEEWVFTDANGCIETSSTGARHLFGVENLRRGSDLLRCFPLPRKALLFDIEVALTGWPAQRALVVRDIDGRPMTMQYRVSRRLQTLDTGAGLYWLLRRSKS